LGYESGKWLGKAMEVDDPSDEQDMNEFMRAHVELPYDKRLQTQIAVGIKGKPGLFKISISSNMRECHTFVHTVASRGIIRRHVRN
jgi:hypothetical protein